MSKPVSGFSKLSKSDKVDWIIDTHFNGQKNARKIIEQYWNDDDQLQRLHDEFIENTITNYYLPFAVAPNFLINGKLYTVPMAIEESSVVAAASKSAKYWMDRGGFKAEVLSTTKIGQVHFIYNGNPEKLHQFFADIKPQLFAETEEITRNMVKRGGGILDIELIDKSNALDGYYQIFATFETQDAMGANFINSCLESFAHTLVKQAARYEAFTAEEQKMEVIMSILSNYVPGCLVRASVSCQIEQLDTVEKMTAPEFAEKFLKAVKIAEVEPFRAVTHNKGLMNGVDAVVIATGNDFRAVEAGIHAHASRRGRYSSLSTASVENGIFSFTTELPIALGTVGGLTRVHPLVNLALAMLGNPSAKELMAIAAAVGLAQNFAAVSSLITTGIQEGHMKMHLINILNEYHATDDEKNKLIEYFRNNTVTHGAVTDALEKLRI